MAELVVNPSLDGYAYRDTPGTWAEVQGGEGDGFDDTFAETKFHLASDPYAAKWRYFARTILLFDTSALVPSDEIVSATLEFRSAGKGDALGISPAANVFSSSPASNTGLCAADYQALGSTPLATEISYDDWPAALGWGTFVLNAQGLAQITKGGITKLGMREANYDAPDIEPDFGDGIPINKTAFFNIYTTEKGTGYIAKLTITYNPGVLPSVTTDPATDIEGASATLNGTLDDDQGEACDCGFEWGETVAYGNTTSTESKTTGQTFSQAISGLDPNKTYHFRAFATNSAGTGYGEDRTFRTPLTAQSASSLEIKAEALDSTGCTVYVDALVLVKDIP